MSFSRHVAAYLAVCLILGLVGTMLGCSDGRPSRVPVAGTVTIDGQPLAFGGIAFRPTSGGRTGGAGIESDGRFSVTMYEVGDGLPPGSYQVLVSAIEPINETSQRWHAPQKYASFETSGLVVEITKATKDITFDLTWKGDAKSKPWIEKF